MMPYAKPTVYADPEYLDYIRSFPCCVCGQHPVDAHHLAKKINDYATVPLCRKDHGLYHLYGIDGFESRFRVDLWKDAFMFFMKYVKEGELSVSDVEGLGEIGRKEHGRKKEKIRRERG